MDMLKQFLLDEFDTHLDQSPYFRPGGSLLLMVGLPGSGKSSIVLRLQQLIPFVLVSTDAVRAQLRRRPTYTAAEMSLVYKISYGLIDRRLEQGQRVVFDASNYLAARREQVMAVAATRGAPAAVCLVQASQETIRERLLRRASGHRRPGDLSDADWSVYKWMVEVQEPVVGPHLIVDTTASAPARLAETLAEYWMRVENDGASNLNLQSPRWARRLNGHN